jgi:YidC/Oxa1 family membrane protein insertase
MDRTSWIVVGLCVVLLVSWQNYVAKTYPPKPRSVKPAPVTSTPTSTPTVQAPATVPLTTPPVVSNPSVVDLGSAQTVVLENKFLHVTLTNHGGAVQQVELKEHRGHDQSANLVLNEYGTEGILNLTGWDGGTRLVPYTVESANAEQVTFVRSLASGLVIRRVYTLGNDYGLTLRQTVSNSTAQPIALPEYQLNLGQANSIHPKDQAISLASGWLANEGSAFNKTTVDQFNAGSILGLYPTHPARSVISSQPGQSLAWAAVKNQFFTTLLTAPKDLPAVRVDSYRDASTEKRFGMQVVPWMIRAEVAFPALTLAPGASETHEFSLYTGPKEYSRLNKLGAQQDKIMDFGFFKGLVVPLLAVMKWFHDFIPNYGLVIILLTVLLKLTFWPMQTIANKNMKQMQALQPRMKEIQEKYKDSPEKLNTETLKLYKDFGVNPAAGCLPMLVQIPVFIGFYQMLGSAVEMRNQSFLWIHDLAQPDTLTVLFGIPLNPLPLLMTATSILMMRLTPQTSDNPQMKMMQWMPLMMLFMLYNFASALALYWTINNLVSMCQTYLNLQKPVPVLKRMPKEKRK